MTGLAELAIQRQQILASFKDERGLMVRLRAVERKIASATVGTDADRLAALAILLERDDRPDFADQFKNQLFERLRGEDDCSERQRTIADAR